MHYLDHACFSPPSAAVRVAVEEASHVYTSIGEFSATELAMKWVTLRQDARQSVAALVESPIDNVALVESTTHGLATIAGALALSPGENVVVGDCDFVGLSTVWRAQERKGVEIRAVRSWRGRLTLDAVRGAVDRRTRVIALSAVQEVSGWPVDLDGVAMIAQKVGAVVVVDGIQEAGVVRCKPARHGIAAYTSGGHKWLRSPYGLGFLWVSDPLLEQLRPPAQGYFSLHPPSGGWANHLNNPGASSLDTMSFLKTAEALEVGGTPNWLGAVALSATLSDSNRCLVEARALYLADTLREKLQDLGVEVLTPPGTVSTIVTFVLGGPERNDAFAKYARRNNVYVSSRASAGVSGVRAGCHGHNMEDDVTALVNLVKEFQEHE